MDISPVIIFCLIGGLLLALPLIIKKLRASAGSDGAAGVGFETKLKPGEVVVEPAFDPDAAFANYMRKREAGLAGDVSVDPLEDVPARPASFGRKAI
jgi:hypothetical protein